MFIPAHRLDFLIFLPSCLFFRKNPPGYIPKPLLCQESSWSDRKTGIKPTKPLGFPPGYGWSQDPAPWEDAKKNPLESLGMQGGRGRTGLGAASQWNSSSSSPCHPSRHSKDNWENLHASFWSPFHASNTSQVFGDAFPG